MLGMKLYGLVSNGEIASGVCLSIFATLCEDIWMCSFGMMMGNMPFLGRKLPENYH